MARLRFTRTRASGSHRARGWSISVSRILDIARAYGIPSVLFDRFPDTSDTSDTSRVATPSPSPVPEPTPDQAPLISRGRVHWPPRH